MNRLARLFLTQILFAGALSGTAPVAVDRVLTKPTVTVTPEGTTHPYAENLIVTATVKDGNVAPTGSVTLSSGSVASSAVTLNFGEATFYVQPGSLAKGADTLTVTYTPDSNSSATYAASTGTAGITITSPGNTNVAVTINILANRHQISQYIYGINTNNRNNITGDETRMMNSGGNQTSDYNWKTFTYNAGGDWFFEDFGISNFDGFMNDSVQMVKFADVEHAQVWQELLTAEVVAHPEQTEAALDAAETAAQALWHALDGMEARRMAAV